MIEYFQIFTALRRPDMGNIVETPANPFEWQRFFKMMERLENAQIVIFQKGRYELHPVQHERVAKFAEEVLASMSLSLELPDPVVSETVEVQITVSEAPQDELQRLRENNAALLYALGSCLEWFRGKTNYSRQNMVRFLEQFEEADKAVAAAAVAELSSTPQECPQCGGYGFIMDTSDGVRLRTPNCPKCHGTGEIYANQSFEDGPSDEEWAEARALMKTEEFEAVNSPADEFSFAASIEPCEAGGGGFVWHDKLEHPVDLPQPKPASSRLDELLQGLPIFQAIASHGVESTKEALNAVAGRVIEQALNEDTVAQLLPEGV